MKKRKVVTKKVMKQIGCILTEITVHSTEITQGIEIKIIEAETVQDLVETGAVQDIGKETETVQDIGKEETQKDQKDTKGHTKRSIITEKKYYNDRGFKSRSKSRERSKEKKMIQNMENMMKRKVVTKKVMKQIG